MSPGRAVVVGLDVGGTKLAAARVRVGDGAVLLRHERPTAPERGPQAVLEDCVDLVSGIIAAGDSAIGIGVCELVSPTGVITSEQTLAWGPLDVVGVFARLAPTVVESDVRTAALAEARYGAGRGVGSFLFVGIGTGISCCLVIDGTPWPGARGNAIIVGGRRLEAAASGGGLSTRLGTPNLAEAIQDPATRDVVRGAAHELGETIGVIVNAVDPDLVVIGGGLGLNDGYRGWVAEALREDLFSPQTAALPVVAASLGASAGVVGAARHAYEVGPG